MSELSTYKCPCCGGVVEFDTASQKPKCPYCDTEFELEDLKHYDEDLKKTADDNIKWEDGSGDEWTEGDTEGLRVYICKTCAGEIIADDTTAASKCPYCGNPIIMKGQLAGDLKPDLVIPFKLDKKAAKAAYERHITGKRLLPKVFKDQNHIDEIKGVYVPFWLYDVDANANIRYRATKVRSYTTPTHNCVETRYFSVTRGGSVGFRNVPVDGSTKMADDLMESIEPFNFSEAVDFQTAYLSGYLADRYDVSVEDSRARANRRIKKSAEDVFRSTVSGYSSVIPEQSSVQCADGKSKYVLYPIWLLNTTWNGEKFTFAMNGQTGKFVGNLPVDKGAYFRYLLIGTAAFSALAFGLLNLINVIGG